MVEQDVADVRVTVNDAGRQGEAQPGVCVLQPGQHAREEGAVWRVQPGAGLDPLRGVRERRQFWQVQVVGGGELVQFDQGRGDLGGAGVLIAFLGEGLPEA